MDLLGEGTDEDDRGVWLELAALEGHELAARRIRRRSLTAWLPLVVLVVSLLVGAVSIVLGIL